MPAAYMSSISLFNLRVPIVNGHMEAVVAPALAVGLPVPQIQAVVERFALVGAGKVHNGGGAAPMMADLVPLSKSSAVVVLHTSRSKWVGHR